MAQYEAAIMSTVSTSSGTTEVELQQAPLESIQAGGDTYYEFLVPEYSCYVFFTKAEVENFKLVDDEFKEALGHYANALKEHRNSGYNGSKTADVEEKKGNLLAIMQSQGVKIGNTETLDFITCFNTKASGAAEQVGDDDILFGTEIPKEHVLLVPISKLANGQLPADRTIDISGFWRALAADGTMDFSEKSSVPPANFKYGKQGINAEEPEPIASLSVAKEYTASGQISLKFIANAANGFDPALKGKIDNSEFLNSLDRGITKLNQALHFKTDARAEQRQHIVDLFGPDNPSEETLEQLITHENWGRIDRKCDELWAGESPVKAYWPMGLSQQSTGGSMSMSGDSASRQEKAWRELKSAVKDANLPPMQWDASGNGSFLRYMGTATGKADFNPLDGNLALAGELKARAALAEGSVRGGCKLPNSNGFDASVKFKAHKFKYKTEVLHVFCTLKDFQHMEGYFPHGVRLFKRLGNWELSTPEDIRFASSSALVDASYDTMLQGIVDQVSREPGVKLLVKGFTDSEGQENDNVALGLARAEAVKAKLMNKGLFAGSIRTISYGESLSKATNSTSVGMATNRRVEITVDSSTMVTGYEKFFNDSLVPAPFDMMPANHGGSNYEPPLFKKFSIELTPAGVSLLKAMHDSVLSDIHSFAGTDKLNYALLQSLTADDTNRHFALSLRTIHGDEELLGREFKKQLRELRYKVVREFLCRNIEFSSSSPASVSNLYADFNLQHRPAFKAKLQRDVPQVDSSLLDAAIDTRDLSHYKMPTPQGTQASYFNRVLPKKASPEADAAPHPNKTIGTQLALSVVDKEPDGFTGQKVEQEFEFGYLRVDVEFTLSAAACVKASLSGGVHLNTGVPWGKSSVEQASQQLDHVNNQTTTTTTNIRTNGATETVNQARTVTNANGDTRSKTVYMSYAGSAPEGLNLPSGGANLGGEVFAGVEASAGIAGKLMWHKPTKPSEPIKDSEFKELGSLGYIVTAALGVGAAFDLKIGFDRGSSKFLISFKAKLVVKVGGGGEMTAAVDVAQIYNFFVVIYEQLKKAEFRIADIFDDERVYEYYCAAVWGLLTLGRYNLVDAAVYASGGSEFWDELTDRANQKLVRASISAIDQVQLWDAEWKDSKADDLVFTIVERCSEEHIDFIRSAPPEVIGNWLWFLISETGLFDWDFLNKKRKAILYLLKNGVSSRREFHEVLEHCLESPHSIEHQSRTAEVKSALVEETAEAIRNRLSTVVLRLELKEWFNNLEGDFSDDTLPQYDWLYNPLEYLSDWIAE
ncbi:OmpA family protein [Salinibius halmophilus]|uniref:OmpA family protein n=1 Tax=Salinibius halmophilus TaxID=1853216 RepID=UPI000E66C755|nr:OmpA family protein [Salinibius halmophilus]